MYNLFVSGNKTAWLGEPWVIESSRVLTEYTATTLTDKFAHLDEVATEQLKRFPAIFAYETGANKPARIGWITRIRHRNREARVEYEIDPALPDIPQEMLLKLQWDLDLTDWELNRTHWALKDVDLIPTLIEAGVLDPNTINALAPNNKIKTLAFPQSIALDARPTVFRVPQKPRDMNLVSVMMPFDPKFDDVYKAIQLAGQGAGMQCERADNVWEESEVIQDIFSLIYRSAVVICDFTDQNPNVFYEAGIAHTLGRPILPIAQSSQAIPFDLRHHRYLTYTDDEGGRTALTDKASKRLKTLKATA